jgi:four helix bundle protein
MAFHDFSEFPVWKKAFALLLIIYRTTKQFPTEEKYLLVSDMRRAANSVIHNIAEGFGRFENKDKSRFYKISRGSSYELISQTLTSKALQYCTEKDSELILPGYKEVIEELDRLIKSVESRKK